MISFSARFHSEATTVKEVVVNMCLTNVAGFTNEKSYGIKVFPSLNTREKTYQLPRRVKTNSVNVCKNV